MRFVNTILQSATARAATANSGWLLAETVITRVAGLAAAVVMARFLGPTDYGLWGMAGAVVALLAGPAGGGLSRVVVKELVRRPQREDRILGTAAALKLGLSLAALLAVAVGLALYGSAQPGLAPLVFLLALSWLPGSLTAVTSALFQSRWQDRRNVTSRGSVTVGVALAKCLAALRGAPLWLFGAIPSLGALVWAALSLRQLPGGWRRARGWRWDARLARVLWSQYWPLMLWMGMTAVYTSIDRLMLGAMREPAAAGQYLAAVRLAGVWLVLPSLALPSLFPYLVRVRQTDRERYERRFAQIYWIFTWSAIVLSVLISLGAGPLMNLAYGGGYAGGAVLTLLAWGNVLTFQAMARGQWIMIEGLQRYAPLYAGIGALSNVVANLLLIPPLGGLGAALATLLSQVCSILLGPLLFRPTRPSSILLLKSFIPWRPGLFR